MCFEISYASTVIEFLLFFTRLRSLYKHKCDLKKHTKPTVLLLLVLLFSFFSFTALEVWSWLPSQQTPFYVLSNISFFMFSHPYSPRVQFNIDHPTYLHVPFFPLPPGLPSTNFHAILSPPILPTSPSHSDLRTSITVTVAGDLNLL